MGTIKRERGQSVLVVFLLWPENREGYGAAQERPQGCDRERMRFLGRLGGIVA